jgi:hypothetical protein
MKQISFCILLLFISVTLFAQNKKGNLLVGVNFGSTGFSFGNSESSYSGTSTVFKSKSNSFSLYINPNIGFYLSDKTVFGGNITLGPSSYKYDYNNTGTSVTSTSKTNSFYVGIGPFLREYLGDNKSKGAPFIQAMAGVYFYPGYKTTYSTSDNSSMYTAKYSSYSSWMGGLQIGYEYYFNDVIGIQYAVGYSYNYYKYTYNVDYTAGGTSYTSTYKITSNNINFGVGLNVHLKTLQKR